ncbi:Ig-like domain-containing protein [Streptomyces gardneri]|uniref:Ig-like domain-containing protein n=1 Tax=Streptomyces gardneri TaxID=66892 RepID=UPI0035E11875
MLHRRHQRPRRAGRDLRELPVGRLTPDGIDTRSLTYKVDGGTAQTVTSTGGSVEVPITSAMEGSHRLTVTATDRAGNVSAETKRAFHVGEATVTAPANGEVLVGSVDLAVSAPASLTGVTFLQRPRPPIHGRSSRSPRSLMPTVRP